jgi:hypothetical protein
MDSHPVCGADTATKAAEMIIFELVWWWVTPEGGRILADDGFGELVPANWNCTVFFDGSQSDI